MTDISPRVFVGVFISKFPSNPVNDTTDWMWTHEHKRVINSRFGLGGRDPPADSSLA